MNFEFLRSFWKLKIVLENHKHEHIIVGGCIFFLRGGWDPRTHAHWSIAPYLSLKFIKGYLGVLPPYRGPRSHSASPLLFVLDPSWQNPSSTSLPFPTPGIRIECVPMFPFHLLHEGFFALLILCSMYCRLICPVRSPTNILQCFLSSLLMN